MNDAKRARGRHCDDVEATARHSAMCGGRMLAAGDNLIRAQRAACGCNSGPCPARTELPPFDGVEWEDLGKTKVSGVGIPLNESVLESDYCRRARARRRHNLGQAAILILSSAAIGAAMLLPPPFDRYGCYAGLIGQPFWLRSNWLAKQWGMFITAIWMTAVYAVRALS